MKVTNLLFLICLNIGLIAQSWEQEMQDEITNAPEKLSQRVENALSRYFTNPEEISYKFYPTSKEKLKQGIFERIDVHMKKAKVKVLKIEQGDFRFHGLKMDLETLYKENKIKIISGENTLFHFSVNEKDINDAITEKKLPLQNPKLTIREGQLSFHGKFRTLFFNSQVSTKGSLEIRDHTKIHFTPDRLKINSLPIPGFVKKTITHKINPIIDLNDFSLIQKIDEINLKHEKIEFISK